MEGHAIEVNDAFGMAKMQPSGPKKKNRNGRSSEGNDGNVLGSFDGDMQGVLGVGWRDRDRQRRRKERQRAGLDFKEGGGGGGVTGSLGRPAGVASHPALRRKSRLETSARVGVRHLRISGQTGHRTVFVGTRLGEVYAMRENPEAESMGGLRGGAPLHEHLASHVRDLASGARCVVTCHSGSVTCLAPHPTAAHVFYTAGADRCLMAWNTRSRHCMCSKRLPAAATCVHVSNPRVGAIAVGFGPKGDVRVFLVETMAEVALLEFSAEAVTAVKFSPNGLFLAAGNRANVIDLYNVNRGYRPHRRLRGHTSFVECLDWSADSRWLQSTCGSYEILYWDANEGRQILDTETIETDTEWETWTCKLGFPVMGIWGKNMSGNDINAVCRSPAQKLLATASDTGEVNVFHYPCVAAQAPSVGCRAHGSHVAGVSFLADADSHMVSVGGVDKAIMIWELRPPPPPPSKRGQHRRLKDPEDANYHRGGGEGGSSSRAMARRTGMSSSLSAGSLGSRLRETRRVR